MKAGRSAGNAKTLSSDCYLSEKIYRTETERIFRQRWLYLGRQDQIANFGSFSLHEVTGEQFLFVCDGDGQIHAHYNVCRHRGTRLCEASTGRLSQTIQCPYHGWTYDLQGRLIGTPNMPEDFDRGSYALKSAAVERWEGFLFVNLADEPKPLAEFVEPVKTRFTPWKLPHLRIAHEQRYDVEANWKLLFQNYSECYHCPTLHPHLNRLTHYKHSSNDCNTGAILGGPMRLNEKVQSMTSNGARCAPPLKEGGGADLVYYYTFFPNLFLSVFPDYVLTHLLERQSTTKTRVTCHWLFAPEALALPGFDPQPAIDFWDLTNRQDWHICELAQQGISSRAYTPGPYSDLESLLAAFDREYLAAMSPSQTS